MCMGGRIIGRPCPSCPPHIRPLQPIPLDGYDNGARVTVPLTGAAASVKILDFVAEVTLKQRYQNTEKVPIEAVYEFPLDLKASVCGFWVEIDDAKIVGQIKEKEKARDTYDDAIASGHGAYLLEEDKEKPNQFTASIGNLPPGKEVLVVVQYVTELELEEGKLKFVVPSLPYAPDGKSSPKFFVPTFTDGPYSKEVGYGLRITCDIEMSSAIRTVTSPSHKVDVEHPSSAQQSATAKLINEDGTPLVNDFVLLIELDKPHEPCARVQQDEKGNRVAILSFHPELNEDESHVYTEMIFVVDRSGSMSGSRIESVKETMHVFLRSLPEGTLFNIVGFGSSHQKLFTGGSKEYNEKTLQTAVDHVNKLSANLGGTDILSPLMAIFQEKPKEGIPRQIFLLTDGEVDNTQECIDAVRKHSNTTRLFTFGIGADASKGLVVGMARAAEGFAEFVKQGENMDDKVMRQLERALKPALTDMRVDWGDLKVQQTPFHLPPLFGGSRLVVYGYLPKDANAVTATLKAHTGKSEVSFTVRVDPAVVHPGELAFKLAAKSMIRDLEENRSYRHDAKGALKVGSQSEVNSEIVKLSTSTGIISKLTSFVAVEKRKEATEGDMQLRKMGMVDLLADAQRGGGGAYKMKKNSAPLASGAPRGYGAPQAQASLRTASAVPTSAPKKQSSGFMSSLFGGLMGSRSRSAAPPAPAAAPPPARSSNMLYSAAPTYSAKQADGASQMPVLASGSSGQADLNMRAEFLEAMRSSSDDEGSDGDDSYSVEEEREKSAAPARKKKEMHKDAKMMKRGSLSALDRAPPPPPPPAAAFPPSPAAPPPPAFQASSSASSSSSSASSQSAASAVRELIKKQRANGSFGLEALVSVVPSATLDSVRAALPDGVKQSAEIDELFITAIVIAFFAKKWSDLKTAWNLVVKKAEGWVKKETVRLAPGVDWSSAASAFLASV